MIDDNASDRAIIDGNMNDWMMDNAAVKDGNE
jgi:hypothetical protein